jgi:hypothetical protein
MNLAKKDTAKTFLVGPILDADGVAKTNEVVASIKVTKNGAVVAVDAQDTLTHDHTGHYVFVSDGGDFDTLGEVEFTLNSGTNAMAPVKFQVLPGTTYDAIVTNAAGGANGMLLSGASNKALVSMCDTLTTYTGNTLQTADVGTRIPQVMTMAQIGGTGAYLVAADTKGVAGTAQTGRDLGAGVKLANEAMGGTSLVLTLGQLVLTSTAGGGAIAITNSVGDGISINAENGMGIFCEGGVVGDLVLGTGTIVTAAGGVLLPAAAPGAAGGLPILASVDSVLTIPAALKVINAKSIAGTSNQVSAAFVKMFNVATPTGTVNSLPDAVPGAVSGLSIVGSQMTVPDTQKVDVNSVKTRAVGDVGSGNTAHLLQAADTGSDKVARTGADSDTLETLSDQMDTATSDAAAAHAAADDVHTDVGTALTNIADLHTDVGTAISQTTAAIIGAAIMDLANGVETGVTLRQWTQRVGAVVAGKRSGTGTEIFVGMDGVTVRVTAITDSSGNRTAITYA